MKRNSKYQKRSKEVKYLNDVFKIEYIVILIVALIMFTSLYFILIYQYSINQNLNTKNLSTLNSSYESAINGNYMPPISSSMISCNANSDCVLVPVSFCQNNLPNQVICINNRYYPEYMNYYQEFREHVPVICPMFIVAGYTTCSCIHNMCIPAYHGSPIIPVNS